ncbi:MAG: M20 family metallopeptidase [Clostridia bacterium]|nr:M20 family metallopeptidase [Clostridia bacterium]
MDINEFLFELEGLVNIDTGSTDCHDGIDKVASYFEERFKALGWQTNKCDLSPDAGPTLVCTNREAEVYDLMMIGHIDTVFLKGTAEKRPFKTDGEFAYGPGVGDMKQGALLMYYLIKEMPREVLDKLNIVVVFNSDEELGSLASRRAYEEYAKRTRYAFIYEGATIDGACCAERKGGLGYSVSFEGVAGHCGFVFTNGAKSAVHEMARWIVELTDMQSEERGTSVNVGVVKGGYKSNVVAPEAEMLVDIRVLDNSEPEKFDKKIEELTKAASERGIGVKVSRRFKPAFVYSDKVREYVSHVEKIASEAKIPFTHRMRGGLSDANIIAQWGALCLDGLGPEAGGGHSDEEKMRISSVDRMYKLSRLLISDLAKNKS